MRCAPRRKRKRKKQKWKKKAAPFEPVGLMSANGRKTVGRGAGAAVRKHTLVGGVRY